MKIFEATLPNGVVVWVNAATPAAARRLLREDYGFKGSVVRA